MLQSSYPSFLSLFNRSCKLYADTIAAEDSYSSVTYRELDEGSGRLANYLRSVHFIEPGDCIGVLMEHTRYLPLALLGVLKSGACFVPLDPGTPPARLNYILKDTAAKLLLINTVQEAGSIKQVNVSAAEDWNNTNKPPPPVAESAPAYVHYTSGSTGLPKGVLISHSNLAAFCRNLSTWKLKPGDRIIALTSLSFDISIFELLVVLTAGLCIVLPDCSESSNPLLTSRLIREKKVNVLQATPSRLLQLLNACGNEWFSTLKIIITGGEVLSATLFMRLKQTPVPHLFHVYGPTETTIWSCSQDIRKAEKPALGKALEGEKLHLLDENGNLCPPGVPGEIYISGEGVSLGYLDAPELSNSKFVEKTGVQNGMFKTGDRAVLSGEGDILFLGRKDRMIKHKGRRIHPEEIEYCTEQLPGIEKAVAVFPEYAEKKEIHVFYISAVTFQEENLYLHVLESLPAYMIPDKWIHCQNFPLTDNGKIDYKKLENLFFT